ncbi:twin-arginine translocase subunit TatC [Nitriliruptoraceae bacterium ZYF776]|nr:twin-arginine translocase subunit TatC [Profundirhabdus halotolerans]
MTLVEHLAEFRTRLVRAAIALAVGAVVGYVVFPYVLEFLVEPYCAANEALNPGRDCNLVALRPLEPFSVRMKTAFVIGLFVGGPVIFYQLWRFITPGLTSRERRYALPFVVLSQLMFALGMAFAYIVIPQGLRILLAMAGDRVETFLSADEYLSFFLTTSVAFGLVFELPLVLIFLAFVGIVKASGLRRARPYAAVGIVTAAAIITPTTDAVTLFLMAGPMLLFYELSILAAWLIERTRRRRRAAS